MKDKAIITTLTFICICAIVCIIAGINTEKVIETERHYISMKWIKEQLLDTDYYFEFDNTTSFLIDGEFNNPSYIYYKYEKGDIIEWNTTSTLISLKWWN